MDLLGISGGMTMDWTPDKYYIMKEWGINPYDPTDTYEGLNNIPQKEIKRLYQTLAEATLLPMVFDSATTTLTSIDAAILEIMGVVYFHNNLYFDNSSDDGVKRFREWLDMYNQPSRLLNWSSSNFVELMRKQGLFLAYMKYGVE